MFYEFNLGSKAAETFINVYNVKRFRNEMLYIRFIFKKKKKNMIKEQTSERRFPGYVFSTFLYRVKALIVSLSKLRYLIYNVPESCKKLVE